MYPVKATREQGSRFTRAAVCPRRPDSADDGAPPSNYRASVANIMRLATMLLFSGVFATAAAYHHTAPQARPLRASVPSSMAIVPPPARRVLQGGAELCGPLVGVMAAACAARPIASVAAAFSLGCACGLIASPALIGWSALYATAEDVPAASFRSNAKLTAKVVKVADGDTFRVAHLPPLWRLRGRKRLCKALGGETKLSESTLQVRIAAVDAPETAKFGSKGQDFGDVATDFVKGELEGKRVRVKLLSRDQYQRAVATVTYRKGLWRKNLSEELLARGYATVYRQGGAQYDSDGGVAKWDKIEAKAKRQGKGIWAAGSAAVDPAAYKRAQKQQGGTGRA